MDDKASPREERKRARDRYSVLVMPVLLHRGHDVSAAPKLQSAGQTAIWPDFPANRGALPDAQSIRAVYGGGVGKDRAIVSLTKSKRAFQSGDGFPLSYPIIRASPASDNAGARSGLLRTSVRLKPASRQELRRESSLHEISQMLEL